MAAKGNVKTRHSSGTKLSEYLGVGRDLIKSELPTLRDVLRLGIKYQEEKVDRTKYTVKDLVKDLAAAVNAQWLRANAEFVNNEKHQVVISEHGLEQRIEREWKMVQDIAWNRITKVKTVTTFEERLDKLLDITRCRCTKITCMERECLGPIECWPKNHITCTCSREMKLPVLDLQFLRSQRNKLGERAEIVISVVSDKKEQERQVKQLTNKATKKQAIEKKEKKQSQAKQKLY